jgi:hypothetical protein
MDDVDAHWAVLALVVGDRELPLGPVGAHGPCGLVLVDDLLRLRLALGRHGAILRLVEVHADLRDLLELVGVGDVLAPVPSQAGGASMCSGSPKRGNSSG